jgi:hypothetical protein
MSGGDGSLKTRKPSLWATKLLPRLSAVPAVFQAGAGPNLGSLDLNLLVIFAAVLRAILSISSSFRRTDK